ncbi:Putative ribonuclease H protein At1g65750 [Linum grandiflorum]
MPILNDLFIKEDVDVITSIPLPTNFVEDRLIWQCAPSGAFTVQSGYNLLRSMNNPPMFEPVSLIDPQLWNQLRTLQVPPKLSFFLWRIFHKILATKVALLPKKIVTDTVCPVCLEGEESLEHIFLLCPLAIRLYSMTDLPYYIIHNPCIIITWRKIWQMDPVLAIRFLVLWWRIWKSRNKVIFDHTQTHPLILLEQYKYQLSELQHLRVPSPILNPPLRTNNTWQPPNTGRIKINVDGATKVPFGGAISYIICDASSNIISAQVEAFKV